MEIKCKEIHLQLTDPDLSVFEMDYYRTRNMYVSYDEEYGTLTIRKGEQIVKHLLNVNLTGELKSNVKNNPYVPNLHYDLKSEYFSGTLDLWT